MEVEAQQVYVGAPLGRCINFEGELHRIFSYAMPAYGEAAYWDQRYQREPTCFDWYQGFSGLEPVLKQHVPTTSNILHVGAGTSQLQADMVQRGGYQSILNTDISSVVVQHMQELHKSIPQLQYRIGDARSMPEFKNGAFDAVIDKGTLDAVLCGEHAGDNATSMLDECSRVLRPGGVLMVVTYGEPCSRLPLLLQPCYGWHVELYVMGSQLQQHLKSFPTQLSPIIHGPIDAHMLESYDAFSGLDHAHFVYVCTKHARGTSSNGSSSTAV